MVQEDKRLKRRVRNSYFISTVSIAMVLFLLGSVAYLALSALAATDRLRESVSIYVMLKSDLSEQQTAELRRTLENDEVVRQVVYVSKDEAAERFIAETGDDFRGFIDFNPLPDSFEVGLDARSSDRDLVAAFVASTEALPEVDEVVWQKSVIEQTGANLGKFNLVVLLFGGALVVISLILMANTVRMTILARRRVIDTMKSVGATGGFIMRPFLASATLHGIYAGLIAVAMFALLVVGLQEGVPEIELLRGNVLLAVIAGGMVVLGVAVSLLFTVFAVDRAVRQTSSNPHL